MIDDLESIKKNAKIYKISEDFIVIAGKTDKDNDFISFKVARPSDLWFHSHGVPGSHVLLRSINGMKPDKKTIELAASIALWHSKAKNAGVAPVAMTTAVYVTKPKGVPIGTVNISKEKIIKVRPGLPDNIGE